MTKIIHIGKKAPKGFEELPGAVHLGKGIWILPIKFKKTKKGAKEGR